MLNTILIDDERPALNNLERFLISYDKVEIKGSYIDVCQAIEEIKDKSVDLIFLDVDMPKMNGIEAAEKILEIDSYIKIVFVTAYNDYAVEAFEVDAVDYIMKPIMKKRLDKTIDRVLKRHKKSNDNSTENQFKVSCFGNFEVSWNKESIKWRTSKAEEFIAYLVHQRGEYVHKAKIIEDLWPDKDEKQATKLLHTSVYYVRNAFKNIGLDSAIDYSNKMYRFDMTNVTFDVEDFEKILNSCDDINSENISKVAEAIDLYKGEYFEGNDFIWSLSDQAMFRKKYMNILILVSDYHYDEKRYSDAITYLETITKLEPFVEENHIKLLRSFIHVGEYNRFKSHYEHMESSFKLELGEELSSRTKELFKSFNNMDKLFEITQIK